MSRRSEICVQISAASQRPMEARSRLAQKARAMKILLLALLASCLAACSTFHDVRFAPAPQEVLIVDGEVAGLIGRALLTVRGVRRADRDRPAQVEVLMRLENSGSLPFALDAGSLQVSTGDLVTLPAGELVPQVPEPVAPGGACEVAASFPLPAGRAYSELDWSGLNLRFAVRCAEHRKVLSASFERVSYYPYGYGYGPYPYATFGWGVGAWGGYPYRACPPSFGHPYVGPFRGY